MLRASLHIVYCTAKTQNTSIITQSSAAQDWFKSYLLPCLHWLNIKMKLNVFLSSKGELNVYHLPPGKYHVNSLSVIKYLLLLKTENHFLRWLIQPKKSSNAFTKVLKCLQHSGNEYFIINNYFNQLIIFKPLSTTPWIFSTTIFHALESEKFRTSLWLSYNSFNWKTFCILFVTSANAWHTESTQIIVAQKVNEL